MTMNFSPVLEDWRNRDRNTASDSNRKRCVRRVASAGFAALFCLVPAVEALAQRRMYDGWQGGPSMMPWNMGWIGSALMFALWVAFFCRSVHLYQEMDSNIREGEPVSSSPCLRHGHPQRALRPGRNR